jgi:hypothetical protein
VRSTGANAYASDGTVIIGGSFTVVGDAAQSGLLLIADERRDRAFEDIHGLVLARGCEWDLRRLAARAP